MDSASSVVPITKSKHEIAAHLFSNESLTNTKLSKFKAS